MKALLVVLLLGVLCAYCQVHPTHQDQPHHPTPHPPGGATTGPAPAPPVMTAPKVHNRIRVTFDGVEHDGWLLECQPDTQFEDSPPGCAAFPHHILASNSTKAKQICARKCLLTDSTNNLLATKELKHKIKIEASAYDQRHAHHAKCELVWSPRTYLAGYNLKIRYLWVDHIEVPFIEVKSCEAEAIESPVPLKAGERFMDTRELILDEKINFLATVLSLSLMALALTLFCCACTFCTTCLCFKLCQRKDKRRSRQEPVDQENLELEELKEAKTVNAAPAQVPVYIPYYMINPYSAPMFSTQQTSGEQTYVMPNAPQV